MFTELLESLNVLRSRCARFYRVALHVHSIQSYDWAQERGDPKRNDKALFEGEGGSETFLAEVGEHLELAAVTDHMRCSYGVRLAKTAADLHSPVILPGMEVSVRPEAALGVTRIHLLAILPEHATEESFAGMFHGLPGVPVQDEQRTGKEEVTVSSLAEWVGRVHDADGVCVAAHVDNAAGLRRLFRQTSQSALRMFEETDVFSPGAGAAVPEAFMEYLAGSGIDAVEVANAASRQHYTWRGVATLLRSDVHCVEELQDKDRSTFVKMTRPGHRDLRMALKFPETRIRFPSELGDGPQESILGMQIVGGAASFFKSLTLGFTDNLNCLIGARGSGKSTVVEAARYVLGYNRSACELGEDFAKSINALQAATLRDSIIRLVFRRGSGEIRVLEAAFDPDADYVTRVIGEDGEVLDIPDVEASGECPVRLFGWSEIETLGADPGRQRDLLDRLVPEVGPATRKRDEVRNKLRENRQELSILLARASEIYEQSDRYIQNYKRFKDEYDQLNTPEIQELLGALDAATGKQRFWVSFAEAVGQQLESVRKVAGESLAWEASNFLAESPEALRKWWLEAGAASIGLQETEERIAGRFVEILEDLEGLQRKIDRARGVAVEEAAQAETELRKKLPTEQEIGVKQRENAERKFRHVEKHREEYLRAWADVKKAVKERKALVGQLEVAHEEVSRIRVSASEDIERALNEFLPPSLRVTLRFVPNGDRREFRRRVSSFLQAGYRYKKRDLAKAVSGSFGPVEFGRMLASRKLDGIIGLETCGTGDTSTISEKDAAGIRDAKTPIEADEFADVLVARESGGKALEIFELMECPWDDQGEILLNGRPVDKASPGERSSAMLPLIALTDDAPLIIDQPEDNLDKRLIGDVLVRMLARLKERRQLIVCTHDPNIVVGGDAEQVAVLEGVSDRDGQLAHSASIDDEEIVKHVIELLEGGAEAFRNRGLRYDISGNWQA